MIHKHLLIDDIPFFTFLFIPEIGIPAGIGKKACRVAFIISKAFLKVAITSGYN